MIWTLQLSFLSFAVSRRSVIAGASLLLAAALTAGLSLWAGSYPLSPLQIWQAVTGQLDGIAQMIVLDHRLPRILTAIGAGAAFGLSGAMFQTMLRNPLASPDVIGFTAGANCGALLAVVALGGFVLPGALAGALLTAAAVTALAWHNGLQTHRLILVGIGASLTLGAAADLLLSMTDERIAADMAKWLTGTLNARSYGDAALIWSALALLTPVLVWLHFPLVRMAMTDETATGLGLSLSPMRLAVTAAGIAMAALAVTVAGPLPFVAFVSGPVARLLTGGGRPALLAAALTGAVVTVAADLAARSVPYIQLPAGVFTALIGAPVLIWLLVRQFRKGNI